MTRRTKTPDKAPMEDRRDYGDLFASSGADPVRADLKSAVGAVPRPGVYLVVTRQEKLEAEDALSSLYGSDSGVNVYIVYDKYSLYRLHGRQPPIVASAAVMARARGDMREKIEYLVGGGRLNRHGRPE